MPDEPIKEPAPKPFSNLPPAAQRVAVAGTVPVPSQIPTGPRTQVLVEGHPINPAVAAEPGGYSPYTGPSEIVPGGQYVCNTTMKAGKHYGGRICDAHGNVLATFDPDQENDGNPDSGKKPEPPK